jgi:DNA repair protein RadC
VAARPEELARVTAVGPAKAAPLAAAFGIAHRVADSTETVRLSSSSDIAREARRVLPPAHVEQLVVLITDGGLRLRRTEIVAMGSATSCPMPVREVVATTLRHDGVAFAVAHNHPGGDPTPVRQIVRRRAICETRLGSPGCASLIMW